MSIVVYFMDFFPRFASAAHNLTIGSNIDFMLKEMTPDRILKSFSFKIYLSTWDRNAATLRE